MRPLENRNNVHTNRQDVQNVDNGNDEPPRKRLRSQSRGPDSCQLVSEMLIKDSRDGCYRKFIRTNNQMVCTYCKEVTIRYTPEGFIEIVGNHLSECKPFNPNDEEVSKEKGRRDLHARSVSEIRSTPRSHCASRARSMPRARSMSRARSIESVFQEEVPTDRYRLEENKDRSKYAAVLILEDNNPIQAKEFRNRYTTNNGDSMVFCCPYCYKNLLQYNKDEDKLYWLDNEENHKEGFTCLAYPLEVLMEKYDRPRRNCPCSNAWWKKMAEKHGFPVVKRYRSALKDMRKEN
ncbi:hypothetical protein FO519_009197 [Halicephalobus sp. NKZ332]|nr:hypothetical protein FO519_009197 [Halicephalobus sp. NKZ332]